MDLVAKTFAGVEHVLAKELTDIGATNVQVETRAVTFTGDLKTLYRANYELRTCLRVLKPIHTFRARNERHLYRHIQNVKWNYYLNNEQTFAIDSTVNSPYFEHSLYVALKTKDAIVDQFRDNTGRRPNVELKNPDIRIHIRINKDECTLHLDSSGFSLHKRGYRDVEHPAPINEALAASLIHLSEWQPNTHFIDLMCGSGTFLVEAGMMQKNIAPGIIRNTNYSFENWDDFDPSIWKQVKEEAKEKVKTDEEQIFIYGSDINDKMINLSSRHLRRVDLQNAVQLKQVALFDARPPKDSKGTILINPPYGQRMLSKDLDTLYKQMGDAFKQNFDGYSAWIFSGNKEALKKVGLRTSKKLTLYNGSIECKFHRYDMYR